MNESWTIEEKKFEINRLQAILRSAEATREEREVAAAQLANMLTMPGPVIHIFDGDGRVLPEPLTTDEASRARIKLF